jgi:pimeloyl-ACP methyl ester carboxylesterase
MDTLESFVVDDGELPPGAQYAARLPGTHLLVVMILAVIATCALRCGRGGCGSCCRTATWSVLVWIFACSFISPLIYVVTTREDEVHFVTSKDGWRINLARYRAAGSNVGSRKQSKTAPVILCHGAFANRMTYDLGDGHSSLAVYLSAMGHDVWVLELRGHGRSSPRPPWLQTVLAQGRNAGGSWSIMKYIDNDLPSAIAYVRNHTHAKKVHWVGHSMGGIVLYSWLGLQKGNTQDFASIVTIGSALDHSKEGNNDVDRGSQPLNMNSTYHSLYVPRSLRSPGPAPFRWACTLMAPFGGSFADFFLGFQYSKSTVDRLSIQKLLANNFEAEPWQVVFEIHTVFSKKYGMLHPQTRQPLLPQLNASLPVPLLAIAGKCDMQFTPSAVARTARHLAALDDNQHVKLLVAGEGSNQCYGHYDMLMGLLPSLPSLFLPLCLPPQPLFPPLGQENRFITTAMKRAHALTKHALTKRGLERLVLLASPFAHALTKRGLERLHVHS